MYGDISQQEESLSFGIEKLLINIYSKFTRIIYKQKKIPARWLEMITMATGWILITLTQKS